ncbi:hypothetical protein [Streptomyces bauhiniae]|uniref:Uncharacterized protein n=1 Tax=Streptomyces bauhiniae TaxID=2340725 RepID=A0A7K3R1U6_9ACTN|nr:hypothetical protein [Streptomyces bauhiniae]NEB96026.1 hypothetical protein [Streptomyces bauhiniae]
MSKDQPAPVEFGAAVDRYLATAGLGTASRRVYRISLLGWAWPLVDRRTPTGHDRRGAHPPAVPLAALDDPETPKRLRRGLADRSATTQPNTLTRELACLRAATAWWLAQGWITTDPALDPALTQPPTPLRLPPPDRARAALALRAPLRELTLWYVLHESRAPVEHVLALNIDHLDLPARQTRTRATARLSWGEGTARLLPLLLAGRTAGPVFVTARRAPATTPPADRCPVTGRGRLSYRRAAELFTAATRPLDPSGHGWTLLALRERTGRTTP